MSFLKGVKPGSEGNTRLQSQYGGGSAAPRQSYAPGYATGGRVAGNPALDEGMAAAEGAPAKATFGRGKRVGTKKAPSKDKSGPKINIVIAQAPKEDKMAGMEGMPPMPPGPPGGPPPMGPPMAGPPPGPPMPPPGAPPMRAAGGRVVTRKTGGRVKKAGGGPAWQGEGDSGKALREQSDAERKRSNLGGVGAALSSAGAGALLGSGARMPKTIAGVIGAGLASGYSMLKHDKEEQRLNKEADTAEGRKSGGKVCKQDGGALGGKSRLQRS